MPRERLNLAGTRRFVGGNCSFHSCQAAWSTFTYFRQVSTLLSEKSEKSFYADDSYANLILSDKWKMTTDFDSRCRKWKECQPALLLYYKFQTSQFIFIIIYIPFGTGRFTRAAPHATRYCNKFIGILHPRPRDAPSATPWLGFQFTELKPLKFAAIRKDGELTNPVNCDIFYRLARIFCEENRMRNTKLSRNYDKL